MELQDPRLYINRELSWLAFNDRVLCEAEDTSAPLFERLRFLGIASSNLDEFFMVRVAGLQQQILGGVADPSADGMTPSEQLKAIRERAHAMVHAQYQLFEQSLRPLLAGVGIVLLQREGLTSEQRTAAESHFRRHVFPALTPLAVDPGHPFPHLRNKSLNIAVLLQREPRKRRRQVQDSSLAVVQVPSVLSRLVQLPVSNGVGYLLLEDLISLHAGELFPGFTVRQTAAFRVTRNWDLNVDEEESEDLLSTIQAELRRRDRGAAVRLEIDGKAPLPLEQSLMTSLKLTPSDVYRVPGPLQLPDLFALAETDPRPELRVEPYVGAVPPALREGESVLQAVASRDILLHHPYDSFDPVVRFLEEAAEDPNVLAIKQTLYRTSFDSPIARALSRAAENGKQVAVLVEIKARLDEANNIAWARRMEENGVHVVYGLIGLKTHCKLVLVVRREGQGIRRYVHLGTGNYNPQTARHYTDLSMFSAREELADDVTSLFNMLTGYAVVPQWKRMSVAPFGLQERVVELISREAAKARRGEPARIAAKVNSLVCPKVIGALYAASQAGVEVDLLVRGICCLKPGVPGVSERIRVTSVVDRFLEHSRVFAFGVGDAAEVFIASADWMPRNFLRRIEVMAPVEDAALRARLLHEVLGVGLRDNVKAHRLMPDGFYRRVPTDGPPSRSQIVLMDAARRGTVVPPASILRHIPAPEVSPPPASPNLRLVEKV